MGTSTTLVAHSSWHLFHHYYYTSMSSWWICISSNKWICNIFSPSNEICLTHHDPSIYCPMFSPAETHPCWLTWRLYGPQIPTTTPCLRCATVRSFSKACSLLTLAWLYQKKWQLFQTAEKQIEELKILDGKHLFSHLIMDLLMFSGTWGDIWRIHPFFTEPKIMGATVNHPHLGLLTTPNLDEAMTRFPFVPCCFCGRFVHLEATQKKKQWEP